MGHLLGYARASTAEKQPQLQVDTLEPTERAWKNTPWRVRMSVSTHTT
jgi:hypothetical protein